VSRSWCAAALHRWMIWSVAWLCMWAQGAGAQSRPVLQVQVGHHSGFEVAYSVSPTGRLFATMMGTGTIKLWESEQGRLVCTLNSGVPVGSIRSSEAPPLAWSDDGRQLLSPDDRGGFFRWHLDRCGMSERLTADGRPYVAAATAGEQRGRSTAQPSGLVGLKGNRVLVLRHTGLDEIHPFASPAVRPEPRLAIPLPAGDDKDERWQQRHNARLLAASADGQVLLLGDFEGPLAAWHRRSGTVQRIAEFDGLRPSAGAAPTADSMPLGLPLRGFALSPDGKRLVLKAARDSSLVLIDLASSGQPQALRVRLSALSEAQQDASASLGPMMARHESLRAGFNGMGFSADGRHLLVALTDLNLSGTAPSGPRLQVRDALGLAVRRELRFPADGFWLLRPAPVLALSGARGGHVLVPGGSLSGSRVTVADVTAAEPAFTVWPLDAPERLRAVAFVKDGWLVHAESEGDGHAAADPQRRPPSPGASRAELDQWHEWMNRRQQSRVRSWRVDSPSVGTALRTQSLMPMSSLAAFARQGELHASRSRAVASRPGGAFGQEERISLWNTHTGMELWSQRFDVPASGLAAHLAISPTGSHVAIWRQGGAGSAPSSVALLDGATGMPLATLGLPTPFPPERFGFNAAGDRVHFTGGSSAGEIEVVSRNGLRLVWQRESGNRFALGFLPQSGRLVMPKLPPHVEKEWTPYDQSLYAGWPNVLRVPVAEVNGFAVADEREHTLAVAQRGQPVRLIDIRGAPTVLTELPLIAGAVVDMSFSPDGRRLLVADDHAGLWLFDMPQRRWLARMHSFQDGSWVVIDDEGRFDTNNVEALDRLHWVLPDEPDRAYPLELYMRDYFEPQLLPKLMAGAPLPAVADVSSLLRARPVVLVHAIVPSRRYPGRVDVTVKVQPGRSATGRLSGAQDARLFRDGKLVAVAAMADTATASLLAAGHAVELSFEGIQLPARGGTVTLSAYAFNAERIKGPTARRTFQATPRAPQGRVPRRAFLVSLGVNRHERPDWDLAFAANDARATQQALAQRMRRSGEYAQVISVALVSDGATAQASKRHLEAVLAKLGGRPYDPALLAGVSGAEQLAAATPDDVVVLTFAGHGFTEGREFYLVPQDVAGMATTDAATRQSSIASAELARWLEPIDAADISVVVDACHSASAVEGEGFKPGPMGAKGLGQLAYDKGIRILAASQASETALESGRLQHGLLTYAIVAEGLGDARADWSPADRRIDMAEWLAYGARRVPELYVDIRSGARGASPGVQGWAFTERGATRLGATPRPLQRPALFDFRRVSASPVICAEPDRAGSGSVLVDQSGCRLPREPQ
jgi:WD40 repeat protein